MAQCAPKLRLLVGGDAMLGWLALECAAGARRLRRPAAQRHVLRVSAHSMQKLHSMKSVF